MPRITEKTPLVLGSASPRRREILESIRLPHVVLGAPADESVLAGEAPDTYLARVVLAKLAAVRARMPAELAQRAPALLVADTSVIDGAAILGKPRNVAEAETMIADLAGHAHEVRTRFVIAQASGRGEPLYAETVTTEVTFRPLVKGEARAYAASGEGMDKAGGYAVQGYGAAFVSRIAGSYTNVVGLPACEVMVALRELGLV
jgi:septum formation protein